jgi:RimJ/RimL family protein N-acetyltransferase
MDPLPYETLPGDGVVLRPPRVDDADDLVAACADPLIERFVPSLPSPCGAAEAAAWIAEAANRRELIVADPGTGQLLGGCRLYHLSSLDRSGEVGYWVAPWARGRGLATAATRTLTDWAVRHGLGRLEVLARPDNPASQRVALAAGYRWEGRRRGAEYGRNGNRYDLVAFARLATDPRGPAPRALPDLPGGRLTDGVVELRPLRPDDAAAVAVLRALPEVAATTFGEGTREVARLCAEAEGEWLAGRTVRLTVRDAASGALAGEIGLFRVEPLIGETMTGYDLLPAWRGRGYATRAVRLLADWAFAQVGLARISAGTVPENVASQRVLERAGFRREGYQRGRLPGPAGTRIDDVLYALLPEDLNPTRTPPR